MKKDFALRYLRQHMGDFEYYFLGDTICLYDQGWWTNREWRNRIDRVQGIILRYMAVRIFWFPTKEMWMMHRKENVK
jgi:hypothetical protein